MKYDETKSIFYSILKITVLYLLSFVILHTGFWGKTQKLDVELTVVSQNQWLTL